MERNTIAGVICIILLAILSILLVIDVNNQEQESINETINEVNETDNQENNSYYDLKCENADNLSSFKDCIRLEYGINYS